MLEIYNIIYDEDNKVKHWLNMFKNEYTSVNSLRTGGWEKEQKITGLYYGLAGIGYSLIRFHKNRNLPSVLYF